MYQIDGAFADRIIRKKRDIACQPNYVKWLHWYKGFDPSFHIYTELTASGENKRFRKASLRLGPIVCSDWANLIFREKMKISVGGKSQSALDSLLRDVSFMLTCRDACQHGFGLSLAAVAVDVGGYMELDGSVFDKSGGEVSVSAYTLENAIVLTWRNGQPIEMAFVNEGSEGTVISAHQRNADGFYEITKMVIDRAGFASESYTIQTNSRTPWFGVFSPALANNCDPNSRMPVSIFANVLDVMMSVDNKYDAFDTEFVNGKKRVYVSSEMNEVDAATGKMVNVFDPTSSVIHHVPLGKDGKPLITVENSDLRTGSFVEAINEDFKLFGKGVGLGNDYYRFESGRVMTATQVISEKSDAFGNMRMHEQKLYPQIVNLVKGIMGASTLYTEGPQFSDADISSVSVLWDDSVIVDRETAMVGDRADVAAGILSKWEFRMKWYGEDEPTAKAKVAAEFGDADLANRINTFMAPWLGGAMTTETFVNNVYPEEANKEDLIIKLDEAKKSGAVSSADLTGLGNGSFGPSATPAAAPQPNDGGQ